MRKQSTLLTKMKLTRYFRKSTRTCKIRLVQCDIIQEKEKPSPLVQGGLEIIIKMKGFTRKTNHAVCEIAYPVDADYKDLNQKRF